MTSLARITPYPLHAPGADDICRYVAVQALRALAGADEGEDGYGTLLPPCADFLSARAAFQSFAAAARCGYGARVPSLGQPGDWALTKDECRMVRALAASQAGDEALLDNYIFKIALDYTCRFHLARAVRALARALSASGFGLKTAGWFR